MVVRYDGAVVGDYTVDLLVERIVLIELKVARAIVEIRRALLNFGKPRLEIEPIVLAL